MSIWQTADRFVAERSKASTWILTFVHRRAVDLVRREERRRADPLDDAGSEVDAAPGTDEEAWLRLRRERPGGAQRTPRPAAGGARARVLRRLSQS